MATIVVTGATGFIGSRLAQHLKDKGNTVKTLRNYKHNTSVDIVYHLACPSTTKQITSNPLVVMDTIFDKTREAIRAYPNASFVNASSVGAAYLASDSLAQSGYNTAKRAMEMYLDNIDDREIYNYRLPSVYGPGMHCDNFIMRCVTGNAYYPPDPDRPYHIAHIDDVVVSLANLTEVPEINTTIGKVYNHFTETKTLCRIEKL